MHSYRRGGAIKKSVPTSDHPLKSSRSPPESEKPKNKTPLVVRPSVPNYKLKPVEKVNFWSLHSTNNGIWGLDDLDDLDSTSTSNRMLPMSPSSNLQQFQQQQQQQQMLLQNRESKLIELNLSSNQFTKVPECLSCLAPKLVKLNLSCNRIESMGAVCDLPTSLKFLDLSNNRIKRSMRLLNENLLRFILFYFTKINSPAQTASSEDFNLDNILVNLLLGMF